MKAGPLREVAGIVGLLALVPTAAMLALGQVTVADAAVRAGVTLLGVQLIARIATWWLRAFLSSIEVTEDEKPAEAPTRRRLDQQHASVRSA